MKSKNSNKINWNLHLCNTCGRCSCQYKDISYPIRVCGGYIKSTQNVIYSEGVKT